MMDKKETILNIANCNETTEGRIPEDPAKTAGKAFHSNKPAKVQFTDG